MAAVSLRIGDEIRRMRLNAGFKSQEKFAKAVGVSRSTVALWESNKREPSISQYKVILELTGHSVHLCGLPAHYGQLELHYENPPDIAIAV